MSAKPLTLFRRMLLLVSATILVSGAVFFLVQRQFFSTPTLEHVREAADKGDWNRVLALTANPKHDPKFDQLRMRAFFRLENDEAAMAILGGFDSEVLESEDLFLLGKALIRRQNKPLGWLAIEAAGKLDPQHKESQNFLRDGGDFRKSLGDRSGQADKIASVPDGHALAILVVGLATKPAFSGAPETDFDRLGQRDRGEFVKLTSSSSARKLLARLFMAEGRADDAIAWLQATKNAPADSETQWLLSRAFLMAGRFDHAVQSLNDSHHFGDDKPMAKDPGRFAGAKSCADCHRNIYKTQQQSRHAGTLAVQEALRFVEVPNGLITDPVNPRVTHKIARKGDQIEVRAEFDQQSASGVIEAAIGSGNRGRTMIAKDAVGHHRMLRISHFTGNDSWDLTEKFQAEPSDAGGFVGTILADKEFFACLHCHSTRYVRGRASESPESFDHGIGCERCHGPGDNHLKAVDSGFPDLAIARPKLAKPADRLALCAQCHIATGEIPPSDPRFIRFQATTLPYSRCFTQSAGQLDCVTCHNPHANVETSQGFYESKCLACHAPGAAAPKTLPHVKKSVVSCPVNTKSGCITCHMPKVENIMPGTAFSDHHIRIHKKSSAN